MSDLDILRQFFTGSIRLRRPYDLIVPESSEACETKVTLVDGTNGFEIVSSLFLLMVVYLTANCGRINTGSTVGILALC
jgi:hypothetical protein